MKARDLLGENESAIVLFTDGQELHIREDRTGSTSNWKLSRKHDYDKVIVYRRDIETGTNEVYLAVPGDITASSVPGRSVLGLANIECAGITDEGWYAFAEAGSNPVRYLGPRR